MNATSVSDSPTVAEDGSSSPAAEQCLELLRSKDDTSRFVGLTMLLPLLKHSDESALMRRAAHSLDLRFLDRLLRTSASGTFPKTAQALRESTQSKQLEAMRDLAISVIHGFTIAFSDDPQVKILNDRIPHLVSVLPHCSEDSTTRVLEILIGLITVSKNSAELVEHQMPLIVSTTPLHRLTLKLLQLAVSKTATGETILQGHLNKMLVDLADLYVCEPRRKRLDFLVAVRQIIESDPPELLLTEKPWFNAAYNLLRETTCSGPSSLERECCIIISSKLLHDFPSRLLFARSEKDAPANGQFIQLFIQLVTIDIRAAFPMLLEHAGTEKYSATALRHAAGFNVLAHFLMFLLSVTSFDEISLEPDSLLHLRKEIGETFSLTIEYLYDLWDGENKDEKPEKAVHGKDTGATASSNKQIELDPLVTSAVKALSLWLREDEGLQKDAAGLTDLFLALWKRRELAAVDYRPWIIAAFQGITEEEVGRELFLESNAWSTVWQDLRRIYSSGPLGEEDMRLATDEALLLARFARDMPYQNQQWSVEIVHCLRPPVATESVALQLEVSILYLGGMCVSNFNGTEDRSLKESRQLLKKHLAAVKGRTTSLDCEEWITDLLDEVESGL